MTVLPTPPTFPPHTHAKLSPRTYLTAHLTSSPPVRPSGRTPDQSRPISVHTGSLTHCHGSAVLRQGDTAVVCGVRAEILRIEDVLEHTEPSIHVTNFPDDASNYDLKRNAELSTIRGRDMKKAEQDQLARLGVLVPNIELSTGCSPDYLPGGPPGTVAQSLSQRLLTALHTSAVISPECLRIYSRAPTATASDSEEMSTSSSSSDDEQSGGVPLPTTDATTAPDQDQHKDLKGYWTLYIDVLFISLDHGSRSAFDVAFTTALTALHSTKLPHAYYDSDYEGILCDPDNANYRSLTLRQDVSVATSFGVFVSTEQADDVEGRSSEGGKKVYVLVDPDAFEEDLCEELLTVTVAGGGGICRIEKNGGRFIDAASTRECVNLAEERRGEVLKVVTGGGQEPTEKGEE